MLLDIFPNLFLCDRTHRRTEVATCPQMLSPIAFLQVRELFLQLARRHAFELWHKLGWTQQRWTRHQHMDVIATDMPFHNLNVSAHCYRPENLPCPFRDLAAQALIAILADPHQVVLDVIDGLASLPIVGQLPLSLLGSKGSLPAFAAKAIRLKPKVLDRAHGNKRRRVHGSPGFGAGAGSCRTGSIPPGRFPASERSRTP